MNISKEQGHRHQIKMNILGEQGTKTPNISAATLNYQGSCHPGCARLGAC
jgi:hypothetical protein